MISLFPLNFTRSETHSLRLGCSSLAVSPGVSETILVSASPASSLLVSGLSTGSSGPKDAEGRRFVGVSTVAESLVRIVVGGLSAVGEALGLTVGVLSAAPIAGDTHSTLCFGTIRYFLSPMIVMLCGRGACAGSLLFGCEFNCIVVLGGCQVVTDPTMLFAGSGWTDVSVTFTKCGTVENLRFGSSGLKDCGGLSDWGRGGGSGLSPGRGILWSLGGVALWRLFDLRELIGVRGGGAIAGAWPDVFSWLSSWQFYGQKKYHYSLARLSHRTSIGPSHGCTPLTISQNP